MPGRRRTEPAVPSDGIITALVARRGQDERIAVHLDGRRVFDLAAQVADKAGLRVEHLLTAERQQELVEEDAPFRARDRALRLLGLRDRSRREMEQRLKQAGFSAEVVAGTVEWLVGFGYLDDRRFAQAYAAEKQRGGYGPRRIQADLAAKGVERAIVRDTLAPLEEAAHDGEAQEAARLEQLVRRRFERQFAADPEGAERRLSGFLARRGYDWDTISRMSHMLRVGEASDAESPSIP